ncbi:MAG TPA: SRPBCC family protein [Acidimicrobiales bacterium]|nr:SRPBCC family protein [Acidimicrobiales bacterium]
MQVDTEVEIEAGPERVWEVMTDVESWPQWTASVERAERLDDGPLQVGSRARLKQPKFPPVVWAVSELDPGKSFSWTAKNVGVTSIGEHRIVPRTSGGVTVKLSLRQAGPLAPLLALLTSKLTRRYVETEAQGLKRRCET